MHLACEQGHKPLAIVLTAGQRGDSPRFTTVVGGIRVPRLGGGPARTRPDRIVADKAYTSAANRAYLRRHGIKATIPSKADQDANRRAKGSRGGRPRLRPGDLHPAPRGGVRHQPAQASPRCCHAIRQARRTL
nr:hypothetical protein GCM10020093_032820 [Planobispora longispora]